ECRANGAGPEKRANRRLPGLMEWVLRFTAVPCLPSSVNFFLQVHLNGLTCAGIGGQSIAMLPFGGI
ncbi:MAG: hypothetical protein KDK33_13565, partial [Leptospiraceae bacterium]|nr:hypothetical protein [Leptospiraceae bacterium]